MEEKIIFSSFLPKNLYRAAELLPQAPRGLLALTNFNGWLARNTLFHFKDFAALHPNLQNCSRGQIALAHLRKRRVHTWTVNKAEDMRRLANWGVDGIFTDDPALAMETLRM